MNLVFFASDAKALSSLRSSIIESKKRGFDTVEISSNTTRLGRNYKLKYDDEWGDKVFCNSINTNLPFRPDWLIVNRERWDPESSIIKDFKKSFNCKVALIEPNAWLWGNCETMLECHSRNRFIDLVDVFFCHSTHSEQLQKLSGFKGNVIISGNPKYDLNLKVSEDEVERVKVKYQIDESKENVLLFSLINSDRHEINKIFKDMVKDKDKSFFYKPYPGEPFEKIFEKDFNPFFLENCKPILEENDIWPLFNLCGTHAGGFSSIIHASLLLSKKFINLFRQRQGRGGPFWCGVDFQQQAMDRGKAQMWMNTLGFNSHNEFRSFVSNYPSKEILNLNQKIINAFDCDKDLLKLFDDFNDSGASYRVIDYLEHEAKK
jgi:hypothetical protein